ncbi:hypothetical protein DFP73DRAFT_591501 [Morchella snyderi]|nr:hypothetical protein DFP73DRAFT_591501 [Morchella snyderi]
MASALKAVTDALRAILDLRADITTRVETLNRMSNTWKGKSRQNQEAISEVLKDYLRDDNEDLAADVAALQSTWRVPPSAPGGPSSSYTRGGQDEVLHGQLCVTDVEEEGEEDQGEQEE